MTRNTKYILDLELTSVERLHERYALLRATDPAAPLPPMQAGQFAQLRVDGCPQAFLRRPISIHFLDRKRNEVWFLVQTVGPGTESLAAMKAGDRLNAVLPLGRGFTLPASASERILLVGGGVGVAPLLFLGQQLADMGVQPTFLLGTRSASDLLQREHFQALGRVCVTTEDGSLGEQGYVTQHSILHNEKFDHISVCGPRPMMIAVARYAREQDIPCEVSLENRMACGVGACLACVCESTEVDDHSKVHNKRICKDGPVFYAEEVVL